MQVATKIKILLHCVHALPALLQLSPTFLKVFSLTPFSLTVHTLSYPLESGLAHFTLLTRIIPVFHSAEVLRRPALPGAKRR